MIVALLAILTSLALVGAILSIASAVIGSDADEEKACLTGCGSPAGVRDICPDCYCDIENEITAALDPWRALERHR